MRRGVHGGFVAGRTINSLKHGASAAFTIGSGHSDHRTIEIDVHAIEHLFHARKTQLNHIFRM